MTLARIVATYIDKYCCQATKDRCFHAGQPNLQEAIRNAVWPQGLKHPHQYRIPDAVLDEAARRLTFAAEDLKSASDFDALHRVVERVAGPVRGIGALAVYDIAHRVGAFLRLKPKRVYLHSGTRIGAAHLGFKGKTIDPKELPPQFSRLTAAETEDCLCIFKDQLGGAKPSGRRPRYSCNPGNQNCRQRRKC